MCSITDLRRVAGVLALVGCLAVHATAHAQSRNLVVSPTPSQPAKEQRIALVIGNSRYDAPLRNPVNDAQAMAERLQEVGFRVTLLEDAPMDRMFEAIRVFGDDLRGGGVGLFYFAGHGVQIGGRNYLIPVKSQIEREDEVVYRSIDAGQVLNKMASAGNRLNIVILDACRSNPFVRSFRSAATGLAVMEAPANTLIAFATSPGAVASDGQGAHGLYTEHLLKNIPVEGLRVEDMFKRVRAAVRQDSAGRQLPWENTSLEVEFFFRPLATQVVTEPAPPPLSPLAIELAFWDSIKASSDPADFEAYLRKFPSGQFAELARIRLATLLAALRPPAPPTPAPAPAPAPPPLALAPAVPPPPVDLPLAAAPPSTTSEHVASTALAVSPTGAYAVSGSRDGLLTIWDVLSSRELRRLTGHAGAILAAAISQDGQFIVTGGEDATVRIWSFARFREIQKLPVTSVVTALAFSPTGRNIISGDRSGKVKIWNAADGKLVREFTAPLGGRILAVAFSMDGRYALSGAADGQIRMWDVSGARAPSGFGPHSSEVVAVRMSSDGRTVVSASADGIIWSWDASTGKRSLRMSDDASVPAAIALSGDARHALIARGDGSAILWDTVSGRTERRLPSSPGSVTAVALSAEGRLALVAADGQHIRLWSLRE